MQIHAAQVHQAVQRDEDPQVVAAARELAGQGCRYVTQPARLGERRVLGGEEADAHDSGSLVVLVAITAFVDPAVDFGLQFQAAVDELAPEAHEDAENDGPEPDGDGDGDGSNVVSIDFGRKK
jgi:hypothetical protein